MMRPAYLLTALALLLASCTDPEQDYLRRRAAAATQPPARLGFRLRLGTPRQRVMQQLDSLRARHALTVKTFYGREDTLRAVMQPAPLFAADSLAGLQIRFSEKKLTKPLFLAVLDSLRGAYGEEHWLPAGDGGGGCYWFSGSTEIDCGFPTPCDCLELVYRPVAPAVRPSVKR